MLRWYTWGNEDPGKVSVWVLSEKGEVISLGQMDREKLPKDAVHDCPYN